MTNMTEKEERVWAYLVANRQASVDQVAEACDVEDDFVEDMMERIGSENWRENVSPFFEADIPEAEDDRAESALDSQVGGSHYKDMAIQPWQAMEAWLTPEEYRGYHKGVAIAYIAREQDKGGIEDIEKAMHHLARLVEMQPE